MLANTAIAQIDAVLAYYKQKQPHPVELVEARTRMKAAIDRLSPRESEYLRRADAVLKGAVGKTIFSLGEARTLDSTQYQAQELASV